MGNIVIVGYRALIDTLSDSTKVHVVTYSEDSDEPITIYTGYAYRDAKNAAYRLGIDYVNYMEVLDDGTLYIEVQ